MNCNCTGRPKANGRTQPNQKDLCCGYGNHNLAFSSKQLLELEKMKTKENKQTRRKTTTQKTSNNPYQKTVTMVKNQTLLMSSFAFLFHHALSYKWKTTDSKNKERKIFGVSFLDRVQSCQCTLKQYAVQYVTTSPFGNIIGLSGCNVNSFMPFMQKRCDEFPAGSVAQIIFFVKFCGKLVLL